MRHSVKGLGMKSHVLEGSWHLSMVLRRAGPSSCEGGEILPHYFHSPKTIA